MSLVVAVHGIAQTYKGTASLGAVWHAGINDGLDVAGHPGLAPEQVVMASYGHLFRRAGRAGDVPPLNSRDVGEGDEQELLLRWWDEAARLSREARTDPPDQGAEDPTIQGPSAAGRARTPRTVQDALRQLSKSRYFRGIGPERFLIFALRQVRLYLHDDSIAGAARERVARAIQPGTTRVVVGHSLGSVVAYETLCRHPEWEIDTFVSLGSPLGIDGVVYQHLTPAPGSWPHVRRWVNVADTGDIVALEKQLAPRFGAVDDRLVHNGWRSHDVARYLSAAEVGTALADALA